MEGLSTPIGAGITIEFDGQTLLLGQPTLEDYGVIQNELVRKKRRDKVSLVAELHGQLPEDVWQKQFDKARAEADKITTVTDEEMDEFGRTTEGFVLQFWLIINRQYPGKYTKSKVQELLCDPKNLESMSEWAGMQAGETPENPTHPVAAPQVP